MNLHTAIDIVARVAISDTADDWFASGWENLPEICESDYERVEARMRLMLPSKLRADRQFAAAYAFLEARADRETAI